MRCDSCNKFVPYDDSNEPEVNVEVDEQGHLSGDVRIYLTCAECSQELKQATFDIDHEADIPDHKCENDGGPEWSAECTSSQVTSRSDCGTNKRTGKPNKYNPRYATTYYGYDATVKVSCSCGEAEVEVELHEDTEASSMEELV
jgi:hypothetical protein